MAIQGYKGVIKISDLGTSTIFTDEAATQIGSTKKYQVTATKRIWDVGYAVSVEDSGSPVSASNIAELNYLFGYVRFIDSYTPSGAITISGYYLNTTTLLESVHEFSLTLSNGILDITTYSSADTYSEGRSRMEGLKDGSLSSTMFFAEDELDFLNGIIDYTKLLVEWSSGDSSVTHTWRAFVVIESSDVSSGVDGIEDESISLKLAERDLPTGASAGIDYRTILSLEFENID